MKRIKMFEKFKNELKKTNEEFKMGSTEEAPVIAPTQPETIPDEPVTPTKPWTPIPTQVPRPGTQENPVGQFDEVMTMFFSELDKIKDTKEGKEMIKNLQQKYGNF
jgi:hypothetical protein